MFKVSIETDFHISFYKSQAALFLQLNSFICTQKM